MRKIKLNSDHYFRIDSRGNVRKPRRDYIVEGDPAYPEEIHTNKRAAIKAAKEMARESGEAAFVIPCLDGYADDFVPYYIIETDGTVRQSE